MNTPRPANPYSPQPNPALSQPNPRTIYDLRTPAPRQPSRVESRLAPRPRSRRNPTHDTRYALADQRPHVAPHAAHTHTTLRTASRHNPAKRNPTRTASHSFRALPIPAHVSQLSTLTTILAATHAGVQLPLLYAASAPSTRAPLHAHGGFTHAHGARLGLYAVVCRSEMHRCVNAESPTPRMRRAFYASPLSR